MAKAVKNILFDQTSANLDSPVFRVGEQVTVIAVGMAPGDSITFEVISLISGDPSSICGCRLNKATNATIGSVQPLLCPSCESDGQVQVTLTENNPVVVLDWPQGALLRAMYHGTGIDDRTVTVWYNETETRSLTDAMRGCVPACCMDEEEIWTVTGVHRCTPDVVEVQEQSNCGNFRWVECGAIVWTDTGQLRCVAGSQAATEIEQTNQCGNRRWVAGPAQVWTQTSETRCTGANVEALEVNQCGLTRWVDTGESVAWVATGLTRCVEGALVVQETTQCGQLRWTTTAEACGGEGSIVVDSESCLTGDGTPTNPLGIDVECLADEVLDTGFNVQDTASVNLSGNGTAASPLEADVTLSPDSGNLLTERANGLYYGLEAPPDIANLFVSTSLGNDANAGTRAAPLATLAEALARQVNAPVAYNIKLRYGETYPLTAAYSRALASYTFSVYDEPVYPDNVDTSACASYAPWLGDEYQRAVILAVPYSSSGGFRVGRLAADAVTLRGIDVQYDSQGQSTVGLRSIFGTASTFSLNGGSFEVVSATGGDAGLINSSEVVLQRVEFRGTTGKVCETSAVSPRITHVTSAGTVGGCGLFTPYTAAVDNIRELPLEDLLREAVYDATTKTAFNFNTNWDPWAGAGGNPGSGDFPPVADFNVSGSGLTANFTDKSTGGSGTINGREWNFGDGTPNSTAINPSHVYAADGSYLVTLSVVNNLDGINSVSKTVTVLSGYPDDGGSDPGGGGTPPPTTNPPSTNPL